MNSNVNLQGTGDLKSVIFPDNKDNKDETYYQRFKQDKRPESEIKFEKKEEMRSRGKFRGMRT